MNWSQENCLIDGHRLTCERREGDLRLVPDDPHLCGVVSAAILCAVTLRASQEMLSAKGDCGGELIFLMG